MLQPYRSALALSCLLFAAAAVWPQEPASLDARLRELEKTIAAVRNLEFKGPVKAAVIARPDKAAKSVQGYYDPKEKRLYLYSDVKGNYEKGVLIHEMVHALQDQHFDLTKLKATLHAEKFGSDAELALAALIEGDATFTMIEVLKKEQPRVAAMLDVPLEKAKNLQNAFLYAQGARYVKMLKDKGGWANVNAAYKFPPRNTASILNLRNIASIDLGPGESNGAYWLFHVLMGYRDNRPIALLLAKSWRGDRVIKCKDGEAWIIACASQTDAIRLVEAYWRFQKTLTNNDFGLYVTREYAGGMTDLYELAIAKDSRFMLIRGIDGLMPGPVEPVMREALRPPKLDVYGVKEKKLLSWSDFIDRLLESDVTCVGESHDSDLHHQVQHHLIKAIYSRDERLAVGMEMFQKPFQSAIDRYFRGETGEDEFLKESEYMSRWGYEYSMYRPIIEFCRRNQLPVAALNAPRELTRRLSMVGYAGLDAKEKKELGPIDFEMKEHRAHWFEKLAEMHGNAKVSPERKERSYQVMAAWDDFMAQTAAEFMKERKVRRMVLLAGSGHIERGFGIPNRLARYSGRSVVTIGIHVGLDRPLDKLDALTDYVIRVQ